MHGLGRCFRGDLRVTAEVVPEPSDRRMRVEGSRRYFLFAQKVDCRGHIQAVSQARADDADAQWASHTSEGAPVPFRS